MISTVERLIRIRKVLGLSQRDLAEEFQVSSGAVGSWEVGDREIPGPVLKLLELYEDVLFPKACEGINAADVARGLVQDLAVSARLKDTEILAKLHSSFSLYASDILGVSDLARKVRALALKQLVESLGETRGLPMKVAQIATFLDPRIPMEMREAFETMQMRGRAMPYKNLCQIFQEEFDRTPDEMFLEFTRQPVASASIGQVHKARLHDGTCVAVKVQHPEVRAKIEGGFQDLDFVRQLSLFVGSDESQLQALVADIQQTVLQECDFEKEAENQEKFREMFSADEDLLIPKVIFSHSRKQVLTMEWIEGLSWTQFKTSAAPLERSRAAKTISKFYAQSMFTHGLVHVDPHPGNYIFQNGKVGIIDFGRIKAFSANTQKQLHELHTLWMEENYQGAREFMKTTDLFFTKPSFDFDRFWKISIQISRHLRMDGNVPFSKDLLIEHRALFRELGKNGTIQVSPDFFWTMLFTHSLLIAGRVDLSAAGNWREILVRNM